MSDMLINHLLGGGGIMGMALGAINSHSLAI